ncbi:MAG: trypsin-like peptidase domain-containing protein [Lewinellaceae bacterium]|nr:trypsin-like peptidase domain-containing protein [Lewinellaceae bacterium]
MKKINNYSINSLVIFLVYNVLLTFFSCGQAKMDNSAMETSIPIDTIGTTVAPNQRIIDSLKFEISRLKNNDHTDQFEDLKKAIYIIYNIIDSNNINRGTAFVIDQSGVAISNYHVVENAFAIVAFKTGDTNVINVEILEFNPELDYAILGLDPTIRPYMTIPIASNLAPVGSDCFAIGHPLGLDYTVTKGIISSYRKDKNWIQTDVAITHGNSGGPLLNHNLEVIGVNTGGIDGQSLNFALNIQMIPYQQYINLISTEQNISTQTATVSDQPMSKLKEPSFNSSSKVCLDKAVRSYFEAIVYDDFQNLEAICAPTLIQFENERNVKKSEVRKILQKKGLDKSGYEVEKAIVEWDNIQYQNNSVSADYIITFRNSNKKYIISHIKATIHLNSQCEIVRAQTELINSF